MARRYVPKTYNNRRLLRIITGGVIIIVATIVVLFLSLFFLFQRYVVDGQLQIPWLSDEFPVIEKAPEPETTPVITISPTPTPLPSIDADADDDDDDSDTDIDDTSHGRPNTYTTEQIEAALQAQFMSSAFGERNPQVIEAKEVMRDRDSITIENPETGSVTIDLTNSLRYKVEFIFDQPYEEFMIWEEINRNAEVKSYRREGDRTIMTEHYYFNDEDGIPVLAFIR